MQKHEKEEINRSLVLESFCSLLSRLDESRHKVSLQLITIDYIYCKSIIFPNSTQHQNK